MLKYLHNLEPQGGKAFAGQHRVTRHIVPHRCVEPVLSAIDFNDKPLAVANEIKDVATEWYLTPEMMACHA